MHICVFTSLHASQRLRLYQIKLHYLREVWPIVTDVQDNLMSTTTKNSVIPAFSPVNKPLWPLQKAWQQNKEIQSWRDNQQKSTQCSTTSNTGRQVGNLYQARAEHISCLYLPRCNGRYDNRSPRRRLKQDGPLPWCHRKGDRMKRWLVSAKRLKTVLSGVQENIRLQLSNGLVKWLIWTGRWRIGSNETESENFDRDKSF